MPDITAYAKVFRSWEALIGAVTQAADLLPGAEPLRDDLAASLAQSREAKIVQENLTGERQLATQRLVELVKQGRDKRKKLLGFILSHLGPRSEKLPQFGLVPIRVGSRRLNRAKKQDPAGTPTTNPPAGGETSNPSAQPNPAAK